MIAARLVWMVRVTGRDAALLDGGLPAGAPAGSAQPSVPGSRRPASRFTARPWPADLVADADEGARGEAVLLDARPRERYLEAPDPLDPRPGHVPGARSVPCRDNLDADGRLLPDDVRRARFVAAGADGSTPVVVCCGSSVTACHDLLVLEHLGLGRGRLCPGSWSQWASHPARPAEAGGVGERP